MGDFIFNTRLTDKQLISTTAIYEMSSFTNPNTITKSNKHCRIMMIFINR